MRSFDEDAFVFPSAWHRYRSPRRGSTGVGQFTPDAKARMVVDGRLADSRGHLDPVLDAPNTAKATRAAGRLWLSGSPDASPLGAAAVAAVAYSHRWASDDWVNPWADVWISERGLPFAAEAAVTMVALTVIDDNAPSGSGRRSTGHPGVRHLLPGETRDGWWADPAMQALLRVRQAVAAATDEEFAEVLAALGPSREASLFSRAAASVLVPDQRDWFEQDVSDTVAAGDAYLATLLLAGAATPEDVRTLHPLAASNLMFNAMVLLTTLVDGTGPAAAPALFHWLDEAWEAESRKRLLSVLAVLPGDEITGGLIERAGSKYVTPALMTHADRFPARTLRLLAEAGGQRGVAGLLRGHLLKHPETAERVLPDLSPAAAGRVSGILAEASAVTPAPLSAIPPVLADPSWKRVPKRAKPIVVSGLTRDDSAAMSWLPGEQERWSSYTLPRYPDDKWDPELRHKVVLANQLSVREVASYLLNVPDELARRTLGEWQPEDTWAADNYLRPVVARFGVDALPAVLSVARRSPGDTAVLVRPFASPEVATLMADWLSRLKTVRQDALDWMVRHHDVTARALIPAALGKAGVARRQAETALLALRDKNHADAVRTAAREYGDEAAAAIETLLATDPAVLNPPKIPAVPAWAAPGALRPVLLRDGAGSLPDEPVGNLITMLAMSRMDTPYPGLDDIRAACEPASLGAFAWSLFEQWQAAGAASKDNWVLDALGLLGDDEAVRRLTPLILAWPGEGGHNRAVTGLQVLARIGTDVALMHLHNIAQRSKFSALKHAAQQMMKAVADRLGLTPEQLADRLVPEFGLDTDGSLRLDYGPRQFVVGFDEQLRPFVTDGAGKPLKALPKPGTRDDATLAPAAYQRFAGLKKDVRTVATDQVRRLEKAMVTNRRWTGAEFRQLFVGHPLLWHIVRRLVWATFESPGSGRLVGSFRVAEDRSLSDVTDDEITLADDAVIGVAHPLHLGEDVAAWAELFADYEILQPFAQLGRPVFTLAEADVTGGRLIRFQGAKVPSAKLLGMERRGWHRESPQDAGIQGQLERSLENGMHVIVEFSPGITIGDFDYFPEQTLNDIWLRQGVSHRWTRTADNHVDPSRLDPVSISEILRDLTDLTT
jgi:hypothetical protein